MRLRVRHDIHYRFDGPARTITHVLRLTPRSHEGQHVIWWRIDVDADCTLKAGEDGFGNLTHTFTVKGPRTELKVQVAGEVENFDTSGLVRGAVERLPVELYLRATESTAPDAALREFVAAVVPTGPGSLDRLQTLLVAVRQAVTFDVDVVEGGEASAAFAARRGNGGDLAQVFVTCARLLGCPARVATGYHIDDRRQSLRHTWAEVFIMDVGWMSFDPANLACHQEQHLRLATGLDGHSAAPVRGTRTEGASITLHIDAMPSSPGKVI